MCDIEGSASRARYDAVGGPGVTLRWYARARRVRELERRRGPQAAPAAMRPVCLRPPQRILGRRTTREEPPCPT